MKLAIVGQKKSKEIEELKGEMEIELLCLHLTLTALPCLSGLLSILQCSKNC